MKLKNIVLSLSAIAALSQFASCDSEKDLIIIEGNLPIKTSELYMTGDATPNGWDIGNPTPFIAEEEDPLVFTWQGNLYTGEIKLCLITGSWDAPFIRPLIDQAEINSNNITDAPFQMHAGDPDEKWRVTEGGIYLLKFDLRNWTMSTTYLKGADAPTIEPIEAETLYIVGDATPNGWDIDNPVQLTKVSDYIFEYSGPLTPGELKACTSTGSWDVPFVRPESDGVEISESGVADNKFVYLANPDNKWRVVDGGNYKLIFDLENWTITSEWLGQIEFVKTPLETETVYMIGDATPGGWSMDDASEFTQDPDNSYIFTWVGVLVPGTFKACLEKDPTYSCPFIRPPYSECAVTQDGVETPDFVFTTSPDDQWRISESGTYRIVLDLDNWTIKTEFLDF